MRNLCFYFQVHQPFRLRTYRFFEIGDEHYYYDDYQNRYILRRIAQRCYLPANRVMLDLIKEYGCRFKISYSISGLALEQFELYAPEVLESFQQLANTGCVEFLTETYSHSLCTLKSKEEFIRQTKEHANKIEELFGQKPKVFRNTELIYSDAIGEMVYELGYSTMLTEGAKHVLGWKSPNYLYCNAVNPKLKLLLKNYRLSDDIAFRFSQRNWDQWPLTADKWAAWLNALSPNDEICNIFIDYETFGEHQPAESGIFDFLRALPGEIFRKTDFQFVTPSEAAKKLNPIAPISVPYPISWADEERDISAWLGNEMQQDAFENLYKLEEKIRYCNNPEILKDWKYLQASDHFYYMCTKWFADGAVHKYFNPYDSPYPAFINYMNVLSDFIIRVEKCYEDCIKKKQETEISTETTETIEEPATKADTAKKKAVIKKKTEVKEVVAEKATEKTPEKENLKGDKTKATKKTEPEETSEKSDDKKGKTKEDKQIKSEKESKKQKVEDVIPQKEAKEETIATTKEKRTKKLQFRDILKCSDNKVKRIIKEVGYDVLSIALKGASSDVKDKFLSNVGPKTHKEIEKKMSEQTHLGRETIDENREKIIAVMTELNKK